MSIGTNTAYVYSSVGVEKHAPAATRGDPIRIVNRQLVDRAISHLQSVLKMAPKDHENIELIKNNLAFYLAVRKDEHDAEEAQGLIEPIAKARKNRRDPMIINTYTRVVAVYPNAFDSPRDAIKDARKKIEWLLRQRKISEEEKENARRHLTMLRRALSKVK